MRDNRLHLVAIVGAIGQSLLLLIILLACAPRAAPVPVSTPTPQQVAPALPTPTATTVTTEDEAWAKVVAAAKKEGRVNAYSFNMIGDVGLAVSRSFEQKYGIKVEIVTGGGAALGERIKTEKRMGTIVADIMDANTFQISNIRDAGATVSSQDIPVLQQKGAWLIDPWANDPERHMLIHTLTYLTNTINTNLVKPGDEPKSLKELAQAKWKGRMTVFDPRQNSGISTVFPTLIQRKLIDLETVRAIGMNDIKFYPTADEPARSVIQGERALYLLSSTAHMGSLIIMVGAPLPVKAVDAEEATVATNRAIGGVKDSPHPNAAKLFINWLLSQEGQMLFVKAQGGVAVRKDVPDFTPAALRYPPARLVVPTLEEEKENIRLFREAWLAKLWGR